MNASEFAEILQELVRYEGPGITDTLSFERAGILTTDAGFVVRPPDGSEFQITVVQSYQTKEN